MSTRKPVRLPGDPLPARSRAYHAAIDDARGLTGHAKVVHAAAEAVSDVWEPLLRDLLAYAEAVMEDPDDPCIIQAREALNV